MYYITPAELDTAQKLHPSVKIIIGYITPTKLNIAQIDRSIEILEIAASGGASYRQTRSYLENEGLTYGTGSMQNNYRRASAVYFYTTPETRDVAEKKYDLFDEPFRKTHDLTAHEVGILQNALRTGREVPEELEEDYEEYETEYEMTGI